MKYTIYKVANIINGKIYIGKHQARYINDSYYGSGKGIKAAIKKYGKENFKKEILFVFDNEEDMNAKEVELITEEFVSRKDTYNAGIGGEGGAHFKGKTHSKKTKNQISKNVKNKKPISEETREKIREGLRGRVLSEETKKKLSIKQKEHWKNVKNKKPISEETREKIREGLRGRVLSEETKKKLSIKQKEHWKNKKK